MNKLSYTIITENDESPWDDQTGNLYHFPNRYLKLLQPGTSVIYYKGRIRNTEYRESRLSDSPHYFGVARVGAILPDEENSKNHYCTIEALTPFNAAVLAKQGDEYLEVIPPNRVSNYWYDGVRPITKEIFDRILRLANVTEVDTQDTGSSEAANEYESYMEGNPRLRYTTVYERNPTLRKKAVEIHGTSCQACNFNFGEVYGEQGEGYIHVHHLKPIAEVGAVSFVNPATDMCVLCANCHSIVHRRKSSTLSLEQVKALLERRTLAEM